MRSVDDSYYVCSQHIGRGVAIPNNASILNAGLRGLTIDNSNFKSTRAYYIFDDFDEFLEISNSFLYLESQTGVCANFPLFE